MSALSVCQLYLLTMPGLAHSLLTILQPMAPRSLFCLRHRRPDLSGYWTNVEHFLHAMCDEARHSPLTIVQHKGTITGHTWGKEIGLNFVVAKDSRQVRLDLPMYCLSVGFPSVTGNLHCSLNIPVPTASPMPISSQADSFQIRPEMKPVDAENVVCISVILVIVCNVLSSRTEFRPPRRHACPPLYARPRFVCPAHCCRILMQL